MNLANKNQLRARALDLTQAALLKATLALTVVAAALGAKAQTREEVVEVDYGFRESRGAYTLHLREDLRYQNPRFNQRDFEIQRVIVIAKSEHGRGEAQADISGYLSERRLVEGRPEWFRSRDPRTFTPIEFFVGNNRGQDGHWMIHLNGNIMVDRVILVGWRDSYRPDPRPPRPDPRPSIEYYEAGNERVQKLIETTKEFNTRRFDEQVMRIRITGLKEKTRVTRAIVEMNNGEQFHLPELETVVREGQEAGAILRGEFVRKVIITAISDNLTGSRAEYRLDFGVRTR